jgi:hypothetical protein
MIFRRLIHGTVGLGFALCSFVYAADAQAKTKADLTRLVFIGDSLTAGFQNSSLLETQQIHGYAALIANQAGTRSVLPLIGWPGIPNVLQFVSLPNGGFAIMPVAAPPSEGRTNSSAGLPTNLAVPATITIGALFPVDPFDAASARLLTEVLGTTGLTQVAAATAQNPTTVVVWLGNNDVLLSPLFLGNAEVNPPPMFAAHYRMVLAALSAPGRTLVIANIPDVLLAPAFLPVEKLAMQKGVPAPVLCAQLGISPCEGSYFTPGALSSLEQGAFIPDLMITPAEAAVVRQTVIEYNKIIAAAAQDFGATLVDINSLVRELSENGYRANGRLLTTEFLGGLFSLDGVHPTNTGYALIANEFIKTMNRQNAAGIPPVAVVQVAKEDPLVPAVQ